MLRQKKTDYMSGTLLIGIFILLVEVTFFNRGLIVSLLLSLLLIYFGRKKLHRLFGKVLFWVGVISLFFTVINMMTLKFLLLAIILYFILKYFQSKKEPHYLSPDIRESSRVEPAVIKRKPLFENNLFGQNRTMEEVYEWNDVNIQTGVGDTVIDLSYTVLPKGEAVIAIRNVVGNVRILVPYEVELSVHHSVVAGATTILEHEESKVFNQTISFQTADYDEATQKLKIITSMLVGDLEVNRV
ncbi:cell wall-active antibiotics response protein LiaF [Bacillus tianshenii]|nr:cell wall-active antibiotics response protein LiaF [Bacillus tianshenii]